jgi:hypothetical protein
VKLKLNKILFLLLIFTFSYSKNLKYANLDVHTLTLPKNALLVNGGYLMVNDKVDVLHLRDSSLSNAVSDLKGGEFETLYGISDRFMVVYKVAREKFTYNSYTIYNTKNDIYFRYHLLDELGKFNSGLSFDFGFVNNTMDDLYLTNLDDINKAAKRYYPDKNIHIDKDSDGRLTLHVDNNSENLNYYPWVGLVNTNDNSFYLRVLSGFYKRHTYINLFLGAKKTKIKSRLVANDELVEKAKKHGYNIEKNLDRNENMFFGGMSFSREFYKFILEGSYEYDRFQRDKNLGYMNSNHILDLSLGYKVNSRFLLYVGGKAMLHQLNGQIPYLYNQYTQTSYDHKYGYAKLGFVYYFSK